MRIIIVGGGVVGSAVAEQLLKDKHHLAMIEMDPELSTQIGEKHDLQILTGSGSSPDLLHEAGVADADMILAVTPNDEVNMIVCAIAAQFNVSTRIARIRNQVYYQKNVPVDLKAIGITSVIHPEHVMVDHVMQYIETPHAVESANFEDGKILLRGYRIRGNMPLAGKTPREIREETPHDTILFAAIDRAGQGMIPDGNFRIEEGDIVYALFPKESTDTFMSLVGQGKKKNRKIIVTGDSFAMNEMAEAISQTDHKVTMVHPNLSEAKSIAGRFGGLEVLHGDCTDADLLRDINIDSASFFVAISSQPDYNIMSALLAKAEGAHEVIATSTESRHDSLFNSIGIDHVVNPRLTAAREILEIIARGRIGSAVELSNIDIEAVRFSVDIESEIVGQPIKKIAKRLKKGSIIGVIVRDNRMILPDGETVIEAGDHVIVITHTKHLDSLSKLFRKRGIFYKG